MPEITVEHPDGTTETIPYTTRWTRTREIGKMRRARIDVKRDLAQDATLERKSDIIYLGDIDTLRLVDVETGGSTWTLVCYSFEWDSNRVPYTSGGDLREGNDQELINNLVSEVSSWAAGTISNLTGPLSFVFSHSHQHEALRKIEKNVPGEIEFRDQGTVDYKDRLGSDKTSSVELSSSAGTIEDQIEITERGRQLDGTHIRILGAHEGEAQIYANLVPQDDPSSYENEVRYSTPRWSSSEDTDWDRWTNKDVTDQATIEREAASLGEELKETLVEVKTTTTLDLDVGDTVQVVKDDAQLDRAMRIHRIKEVSEGATTKRELLLSTRTVLRTDESQDLRDIQRFNTGFQGSSVVIQGGGSRQPVASTINAEYPFRYPDLEYENSATLLVKGLSYRAYSQGAASGGDHSHDVTVTHPSHSHSVDVDHPLHSHDVDLSVELTSPAPDKSSSLAGGYTLVSQTDIGSDTTISANGGSTSWSTSGTTDYGGVGFVEVDISLDASEPGTFEISALNGAYENLFRGDGYTSIGDRIPINAAALDGDSIDVSVTNYTTGSATIDSFSEIAFYESYTHDHSLENVGVISSASALGTTTSETSNEELGTTSSETSDASGPHTHEPQAGIVEFTETPSNVDVIINGTTVATDIGSGVFQTEIDITRELDANSWNTVEISSDSIGHIQAAISVDAYKQIGKR